MKSDYLQAAGKPGLALAADVRKKFLEGLQLLDEAAANVTRAGECFASIPAETWNELVAEAPPPMRRTLGYVRAVGEGSMIPQLATASGAGVLRLRALPVADQLRLWTEPVEMFAPGRIGKHAKYLRFVTEMSGEEVARAFARTNGSGWRLRGYDEQKAFAAEEERKKSDGSAALSGIDRPGRWAVRNGKVYLAGTKASGGLTRRDLEAMLRDLNEGEGE